jgi:hypothetical protein
MKHVQSQLRKDIEQKEDSIDNGSQEIELGLVSPEQMEQFHNIVPMANPTRRP